MIRLKKKQITLLLTILFLYIIKPNVIHGEEELKFETSLPEPGDYLQSILYTFIVLILIIGLIIVLIKILASRNRSMQSNRSIKTLNGIQLGQNKSIQVIEIGRAIYVIGVGDNVELIEKIDEAEEISYIKQSIHTNEGILGSSNIASLSRFFSRFRKKDTEDDADDMLSFQEVFNDKMKRIKNQNSQVEHLLEKQDDKERIKNI